jgi:hypothetical protein
MQVNPATSWDIMVLPVEGADKSGWKMGETKTLLEQPVH